jgi:hypothetical protein
VEVFANYRLLGVLQFAAEHGDYVVGGDYAGQFVLVVDYGEGYQIVFVKQFRYLDVAGGFVGRDQRFLG